MLCFLVETRHATSPSQQSVIKGMWYVYLFILYVLLYDYLVWETWHAASLQVG